MKKTLLLIIASLGFAIIGLKAQPCTPDPNCIDIEDPGQICPLAFDTAYVNTAYEQVITFIPPSVFNYNGNNVEVQKIVIDNVTDLPEGITWAADAQEFIPTVPETKYCAVIYGTPTTEGVFPFHLSASVTVLLGGYVPIPIPVTEETLDYTPILVVRPENEAPPVAEFTAETTTADINESITFTDLSYNATSWIWNFEGADQEESNEQNPTATWSTQGTYNVSLTAINENGEYPKYDYFLAENYITINDFSSVNPEFSKVCAIYPNPSTGIVNIEANDIKSVSVYNALGQEIYVNNNETNSLTIDLSSFEKGNYIVNIVTEKGKVSQGITLE